MFAVAWCLTRCGANASLTELIGTCLTSFAAGVVTAVDRFGSGFALTRDTIFALDAVTGALALANSRGAFACLTGFVDTSLTRGALLWIITAVGWVGAGHAAALHTVETTGTITHTLTDERTSSLPIVAIDAALVGRTANFVTAVHR